MHGRCISIAIDRYDTLTKPLREVARGFGGRFEFDPARLVGNEAERVLADVGPDVPLEEAIREALRRFAR